MTISKAVLSVILTAMVSVLGAAAIAYTDVQVLKKEVTLYREDIRDIKDDIREIRNALRR